MTVADHRIGSEPLVETTGAEGHGSALRLVESDAPAPIRSIKTDLLIDYTLALDSVDGRDLQCNPAAAVALIESQF